MSATYCLLVGLQGPERIAVLDALDVPELAQNRRPIEPTDRLVIVARNVAAEARSTTATTWRRLGRKVDIIEPGWVRAWRMDPERFVAPRFVPLRMADRPLNYAAASTEWGKQRRPANHPCRCALCGEVVGSKYLLTSGSLWAHPSCQETALADLALLATVGDAGVPAGACRGPGKEGRRARFVRLVDAGLLRAETKGLRTHYYRAQMPITGG